jgi:hypothetical protein
MPRRGPCGTPRVRLLRPSIAATFHLSLVDWLLARPTSPSPPVAVEATPTCAQIASLSGPPVVDLPDQFPGSATVTGALPLPAEGIRRHVQPDHPVEDGDPANDRLALEADPPIDLHADEVEIGPVESTQVCRQRPSTASLTDKLRPLSELSASVPSNDSSMTRSSSIRRMVFVPWPPPAHDTAQLPSQKSSASAPSGSAIARRSGTLPVIEPRLARHADAGRPAGRRPRPLEPSGGPDHDAGDAAQLVRDGAQDRLCDRLALLGSPTGGRGDGFVSCGRSALRRLRLLVLRGLLVLLRLLVFLPGHQVPHDTVVVCQLALRDQT